MIQTNLTFPHTYEILDREVQPQSTIAPFGPDGCSILISTGDDCVAVILPLGDWGYCQDRICIASTPNPDRLCVAAAGRAFLIDTSDGFSVEDLNTTAACNLVPLLASSRLAVVDLTRVISIGPGDGYSISEELSDDAMEFVGSSERNLVLQIYSASEARSKRILYDVQAMKLRSS